MTNARSSRRTALTRAALLTLTGALGPAAVLADVTPIPVAAGDSWTHPYSGVTMPAMLDGFRRDAVNDFAKGQLDIAGTYQQPDTASTATVYVFHAGLLDTSIWHDRILVAIDAGKVGKPDFPHAVTATFTPHDHGADSGIRTVVPLLGDKAASTGVAAFAHDEWLVVVRMTSRTLTTAQLDAQLARLVDAMGVPGPKKADTAAYAIAPCPDALPNTKAKRLKADPTGGIVAAALLSAMESGAGKPDPDKAPAGPPPQFCRDAASTSGYGVYRLAAARDRYVLAVGDAGVGVDVAPDVMAALLNKGQGQYAVTLSTVDARMSFAPFAGLPGVGQVVELIDKERPASSVSRPVGENKNSNITITMP